MKVTIIAKLPIDFKGGVERQVQNIKEYLWKLDDVHTTIFYFVSGSKTVVRETDGLVEYTVGCRIFFNNICFDFWKIWRILGNECDVFIFHLPNPVLGLALLLRRKRQKWVVYFHSRIWKFHFFRIFYFFQKRIFRKADKIIVTTARFLKYPEISFLKERVRVLPNWVNEKFILSDRIKKSTESVGTTVTDVLFVGRLVWYKGILVLLAAINGLPVHLNIAGAGPYLRKIKRFIRQKRMTNVTLLGEIPDNSLRDKYRSSDLFILPSINEEEGFGIAILESMANRLPVIAPDLDTGIKDVVINKETGLLYNAGDPVDLRQKILFSIKNKEFMEKLAQNAYNNVMKNYREEKVAKKLYSLMIEQ